VGAFALRVVAGLAVLSGVVVSLIGFRATDWRPAGSLDHDRLGRTLRGGGLLLLAWGAAGLVIGTLFVAGGHSDAPRTAAPAAAQWQRVSSFDGACSAEFPAEPRRESMPAPMGSPNNRWVVDRPLGGGGRYSLTYYELPPDSTPLTNEQWFDQIRDGIPLAVAHYGGERTFRLQGERTVTASGVTGREWQWDASDGRAVRARVFIVAGWLYEVAAENPSGKPGEGNVGRFLDSFRFEEPPG
jgi:hypothetical protein